MSKSTFTILLLSTVLLGVSCKKIKANRLSGNYHCSVKSRYWEMGTIDIDSTWNTTITITQEGKSIVVFDKVIPVELLKSNAYYKEGDDHENYQVKALNDSLYYSDYNGGLGGGFSRIYSCGKAD